MVVGMEHDLLEKEMQASVRFNQSTETLALVAKRNAVDELEVRTSNPTSIHSHIMTHRIFFKSHGHQIRQKLERWIEHGL